MINKELIELQKGNIATCAVILNEDCEELDSKVAINGNSNDNELLTTFKNIVGKEDLNYFVIKDIDKIDESLQNRYYHIVKDREFYRYELPKDMIIVLTVNDREGLKNISQELYHFCVVAF